MATNKIDWIDSAKGLGILFVVFGHIYIQESYSQFVYIFHMPLFFIISGYLYSKKSDKTAYIKDKAIHLLVPYLSFIIVIYIPFAILRCYFQGPDKNLIIAPLIGGRMLTGYSGVFWFVTCLFVVQQIMNLLITRYSMTVNALIMLVFLTLSYVNSILIPEFWLPLNANVALAACPFFFIGHLARKIDLRNKWAALAIGIGASASIIIQAIWSGNIYDMKFSIYGTPIVTFLSAISLTGATFMVAKLLPPKNIATKILSKLGEASMIIMFLHQFVQMTMFKFPLLSSNGARFAGAITITTVAYCIIQKNVYGRALFLGSSSDFKKIINMRTHPISAPGN